MATYCPTCGLENQADRNFCRGCGTNLRVVQTALAMGPARHDGTDSVSMTKNRVAEILLKKIAELQVKKADDLEDIIEQIEKLMESDDVRKSRHIRNAVIATAIVAGGVCFLGLGILKDSGASASLILVPLAIFFSCVVPALLFSLYRLGKSFQQSNISRAQVSQVDTAARSASVISSSPPETVTEHTTRQLDDARYQTKRRDIT